MVHTRPPRLTHTHTLRPGPRRYISPAWRRVSLLVSRRVNVNTSFAHTQDKRIAELEAKVVAAEKALAASEKAADKAKKEASDKAKEAAEKAKEASDKAKEASDKAKKEASAKAKEASDKADAALALLKQQLTAALADGACVLFIVVGHSLPCCAGCRSVGCRATRGGLWGAVGGCLSV